jgi:hypothetical protein
VDLRGIFDAVRVEEGVEFASGAYVYFSVRGVHGQARLTLRYVDLRDDVRLLVRPVRVEGTPLDTIDISVRVNAIPVPHSGAYVWELLCGPELLGSVRIEAFVS